jgi:pyruvate/2-oxoglutarate/acetoin dehydrogenase E1 component
VSNRELKFFQALNEGLDLAMQEDSRVYLMGLGAPDANGFFGSTKGLIEKYGPKRVFDMPISESAMTGVAVGSALVGMRPVMAHMRLEFSLLAVDQIANQAAKWHYMFGGQATVPITIRMIVGRGWGQGPQHSQSLHAWFAHIPGLKVVMPATPYDAKGLLISSIEDDSPVVFIEHRWLYNIHGHVPEGIYRVPLGVPNLIRRGKHATIVASSYMTLDASKAANLLAAEGIEVDVIDLRTLNPLDDQIIFESVAKTGHLIVCDHATYTGGFAGEIVSRVVENCFSVLKSPPQRITLPDCPTPTTRALSNYFYPQPAHIVNAVKRALGKPTHDPFKDILPTDFLDAPDLSFSGPF